MRHNETKNTMKPEEMREEMERYEVEAYLKQIIKVGEDLWRECVKALNEAFSIIEWDEKLRIEGEEALCWAEYERQKKQAEKKLLQKDLEAFEEMEKQWKELEEKEKQAIEFEIAVQMLENEDIPVKDEDVEMEIEECLSEEAAKSEKKAHKAHKGIDYRRKQSRRVKKMLVRNAIVADKSASKRSKAEMRRRKKTIKPGLLKKYPGESNSHRIFRQYDWEYNSQSARAMRLRKEAEKLVPELNDFSQKHLEDAWQKKEESRAKQIAKAAEKEAAKQTA